MNWAQSFIDGSPSNGLIPQSASNDDATSEIPCAFYYESCKMYPSLSSTNPFSNPPDILGSCHGRSVFDKDVLKLFSCAWSVECHFQVSSGSRCPFFVARGWFQSWTLLVSKHNMFLRVGIFLNQFSVVITRKWGVVGT